MSYKLLTNLLFEPRGKHNPSLTYNIKDTVMSEDGSKVYFALDNVPAGIPLTDTNYWMLQIDLSASKAAMDTAAATARTQTDATIASANTRVEDMMGKAAEAVTSVADYATKLGMRVKGETKITKGNPMTIYPDGGSLLKVQTDIPIKQLGSGDPYPAGGGRNLIPPLNESVTTNGITFTPRADGKIEVSGTLTDTGRNAVAYLIQGIELPTGTYTLSGSAFDAISISIAIERASGAVDYFNADSGISRTFELETGDKANIYVQVYTFRVFNGSATVAPQLERGSVATGFEKHENIRSFIGYDKLNLNVAGKNLIGGWVQGAVNSKGEEFSSSTVIRSAITKVCKKNVFVTVPYDFGYFLVEYADGTFLSRTDRNASQAFILRDNTTHIRLCLVKNNGSAITLSEAVGYQVEYGTVGTEVVPYQGKTHTVQLDKTTYQGHYDWLTGKFRAEWVARSFDGTNDNWRVTQYSNLCAWVDEPELVWSSTFYSSHFKCYNSITGESDGTIGVAIEGATSVSFGLFFGIKGIASTVDEWNAYLAAQKAKGTPVQVAYKLATPIEIQLAPNVITAVEDGGLNHIYGDADLTVEWVKPLETSLTEHSNAKVDANNEALLMDVAQKERSVGNPVVINDAVANVALPHVETEFAPKQSGSGDPYPAGGGKNLIDISSCRTLTLADRTTTINGEMVTVTSSAIAITQAQLVFLPEKIVLKAGTTYTIVLTSPVNFVIRIGFVVVPVGSLSKTFTPNEDITTDHIALDATEGQSINATFGICLRADNVAEYAPYSNIRPITGYDKLELVRCGTQILDDTNLSGIVLSTMHRFPAPFKVAGTYAVSVSITGGTEQGITFALRTATKNIKQYTVSNKKPVTIEVTDDILQQLDNCTIYTWSGSVGATLDWIMINKGSTALSYVPYAGKLHTVQIGETVYGGRYNWLTGKLTKNVGNITLDGSQGVISSWPGEHGNIIVAYSVPDALTISPAVKSNLLISNKLKTETGDDQHLFESNTNSVSMSGSLGCIAVCIRGITTLSDMHTWLSQNPVECVYPLATPIEIQLDPTRITTIPGTNTIFGDGEFTIDWFKSYKKVAEERENLLLDSFTDKAELSGNPIVMTPVGGIPFDSVVTEFAPKQSGSGDPYPAGGGRNLFNPQQDGLVIRDTTIDGDVITTEFATGALYIQTTDVYPAGTYTISVIPISDDVSCSLWLYDANDNSETFGTAFSKSKNSYTFTKDAPFYFGIGGISAALGTFRYKIQLELGSTATPYTPYSNIRPITGYDAVELNHAGKNLWPNGDVNGTRVASYEISVPAGNLVLSGVYQSSDTDSSQSRIVIAATNGEEKLFYVNRGERFACATNFSAPIRAFLFYASSNSAASDGDAFSIKDIQLEFTSAATPFTPYQGNTLHTVQIGQTVYGGKFDWLTGKLMAEWTYDVFDSAKTFNAWGADYPHLFCIKLNETPANWDVLCSHYKQHESYDKLGAYIIPQDKWFLINDVRFSNVNDFNAEIAAQYAAGTPVQIAYKLAKPFTIQLAPTEIIALTGTNTLYGDGDTITTKFRQSKDVDILKRLSALETLMTNQTKGE